MIVNSGNVIMMGEGIFFMKNLVNQEKIKIIDNSSPLYESKVPRKFQNLELVFYELKEKQDSSLSKSLVKITSLNPI